MAKVAAFCGRQKPVMKDRVSQRATHILAFSKCRQERGEKEYTPPPWHPSFLCLSPDPKVTELKKAMVFSPCFGGKTREKGIHHRSGKKGIHHRASDPEKEKRRVSTVVVYTFFFPAGGNCILTLCCLVDLSLDAQEVAVLY